MDHRRWLVLVIYSVVLIFQIDSLFGKSNSRFFDHDRTYRREISVQTGLIQLQSSRLIQANPEFDLRFYYRPSIRLNNQLQTSSHWWFGYYIGYGEVRTDYFLKLGLLPKYHTRLGFIACGNFLEGGAYGLYRRIILDHWMVQGKLGIGGFMTPGFDRYEQIQEGNSPYLSRYAEIHEVSTVKMERMSAFGYLEIQAGRIFGRHSVGLSVGYQRFGIFPDHPANIFEKKYEIYTGKSNDHYANLNFTVADACRFELVYSFQY